MEAAAPTTTVKPAPTTASAVETAPTTTAMAAMLGEYQIWCERKRCESSQRDERFKKTKFTHNLSFRFENGSPLSMTEPMALRSAHRLGFSLLYYRCGTRHW
jgi:hypothetical protein